VLYIIAMTRRSNKDHQVESTLFNVPKHVFDESPIFQDMFSVPPGASQSVDGLSDQQPLRLEGVSLIDFRCLLNYLYPV
jgi:hypothetical protein